MSIELMGLFPIPVGFRTIEKPLTKTEKDFILGLERGPNMGNFTSKERYLTKHKKFKRLGEWLEESVNMYFREVHKPKFDVKLRITQCWANYSEKNNWHHQHAHPNSFISGVFYVQADPQSDKIFFSKTKYNQLEVPSDNFNIWNSQTWWFENVPGRLVMFPSSLSHYVDPVKVDQCRVSISFNTFPVGTMGDGATLTELLL